MEIILPHVNTDFDAFGAMVAATVIYPEAKPLFPGSLEPALTEFIRKHPDHIPQLVKSKDISLDHISRLIVVDCQSGGRIGKFGTLAHKDAVSRHIYDHHPSAENGMVADGGRIEPGFAATCTLMVYELIRLGLSVTPQQATVMMLGIYEDTGKLLFPSTTAAEFKALAWLIEQGGDIRVVAESLAVGFSALQISLLDTLLQNLSRRSVNGREIAVAVATADDYVPDIAQIASTISDMEHLDALFVAVETGGSVVLIGRSRVSEVNAGEILREMGGGGHPSAASATLRNCSLHNCVEQLGIALNRCVKPLKTAASVMSSPVKSIPSGTTLKEGLELLVRFNCTAMPVVSDGKIAGIISRKTVEKGLYHSLAGEVVDTYMHTDIYVAAPETSFYEIQHEVVVNNRRFVPVIEAGSLVGCITRSDILRHIHDAGGGIGDRNSDETLGLHVRHHDISRQMTKQLPAELIDLLRELGTTADSAGVAVYAVGGFVRDFMLGISNLDIDVTTEGDGIVFAERFVAEHDCRIRAHNKFGTAVIIFPDGSKLDVASTRLEYYSSPGSLPIVERSSLRHDLYRRDFTINTLAISLNTKTFGIVTDFYGGRGDIESKTIKVLHNLSFVEDPTRIFRAIRFEQRLGFRISRHTESLMRSEINSGGISRISGTRILNELKLILSEKEPLKPLFRMGDCRVLQAIAPNLVLTEGLVRLLEESAAVLAWFRLSYQKDSCEPWELFFLALTTNLTAQQFGDLLVRLQMPSKIVHKSIGKRNRARRIAGLFRYAAKRENLRNSTVYMLLDGMSIELILYLSAIIAHEMARKAVTLYLTELRHIKLSIGGNDLKQLGITPCSSYGKILQQLLRLKLDGLLPTRDDEMRAARELSENRS